MENKQELNLTEYCNSLGINLPSLSKKTTVAVSVLTKMYNRSVYDFEVFALKNQVKFEANHATDFKPIPVNNSKLIMKHPFKFTLIDKEGKVQSGIIQTSRSSLGIKILKIKYPRSTKHKLTVAPNSWISGVKQMGGVI